MGRVTQGQNKKDIGDDDGLLLLDGAERVLLLVLPRVQAIVPQLWKTKGGRVRGKKAVHTLAVWKRKIKNCKSCFRFCLQAIKYPVKNILIEYGGSGVGLTGGFTTYTDRKCLFCVKDSGCLCGRLAPEVMSMLCLSSSRRRIFSSSSLCTVSNSSNFSLWQGETAYNEARCTLSGRYKTKQNKKHHLEQWLRFALKRRTLPECCCKKMCCDMQRTAIDLKISPL